LSARRTGTSAARKAVRHARPASLWLAVLLLAPAAPAAAIELAFPVACVAGTDCAIQHYVDRDPGPDALDYRCGHQTYDGHSGVDIRVPTLRDMTAGVSVLAAADGEVTAIRDDMDDISVKETGPEPVVDRECGNGVVVDHGDGWESQYCHMKLGSIAVEPGEAVTAGSALGQVGLSGMTEFPHLHFTLRKDGETVDPFDAGGPAAGTACAADGNDQQSLWNADLAAELAYRPAFVLNAGFSDGVVTMDEVGSGLLEDTRLHTDSPALVFFGRAISLETGDVQRLVVTGPDGAELATDDVEALERPKAEYFAYVGRKASGRLWPAGAYRGRYSVIRDGAEIAVGEAETAITE
jgi:hypothetical protein